MLRREHRCKDRAGGFALSTSCRARALSAGRTPLATLDAGARPGFGHCPESVDTPSWWPVLAATQRVALPRAAPRSRPRADTRSPFLDGHQSLSRCAAATSPAAPAPILDASSRRPKRWPSRRGSTAPSASSTSRTPTRGGWFCGVHGWPVLGVHRGKASSSPISERTPDDRSAAYCRRRPRFNQTVAALCPRGRIASKFAITIHQSNLTKSLKIS